MKTIAKKISCVCVAVGLPAAAAFAQDVPVIQVNTGNGSAVQGRAPSQNSELLWTIQQLQDEVRRLRGQVESQQYQLERMEAKQKTRYRDLDRRISLLVQEQMKQQQAELDTLAPAAPTESDDTVQAPLQTPETEQPAPVAAEVPTPPASSQPQASEANEAAQITDKQAYQDAFALVRERKFNEAAQQFESFLSTYADSPRLPNAHYWLGEIYLAQGKHAPSEQAFTQVVEQFGDSRKAPDAMYKLGILYKQQGNLEKYTAYMAKVVEMYPDTSAARLAESALSQ